MDVEKPDSSSSELILTVHPSNFIYVPPEYDFEITFHGAYKGRNRRLRLFAWIASKLLRACGASINIQLSHRIMNHE